MAALVNYTPVTRQGTVRALLHIGAYGVLSACCLLMLKYASVPAEYDTADTGSRLLAPVFTAMMIGIGISLTRTQIRRGRAAWERERNDHTVRACPKS